MEINIIHRQHARDILLRLKATFGADVPELALKMGIKPNYLYSIIGEYKHRRSGKPHCPAEAVNAVITWGEAQ